MRPMSYMENSVYKEDIEHVVSERNIPWDKLAGKRILMTGGTGVIGNVLLHSLLRADEKYHLHCGIRLVLRNLEKAKEIFGEALDRMEIIEADVAELPPSIGAADYIIHAASMTASKAFIEQPVETIRTNLSGTMQLLELARKQGCENFVYLSTMEVYGAVHSDEKIKETQALVTDSFSVRNSYPISKIMCECLCRSYASEYGVKTAIVRPTLTFGAGVSEQENRVFAEFARNARAGKNIVLKTKGETKRDYLYTSDAARAILTVMLKGKTDGAVYNAANEATYCTIAEMAELVAGMYGVRVKYDLSASAETLGYAPVVRVNLDTGKLRKLGWKPGVALELMYRRLGEYWDAMQTYGKNIYPD